MSIKSILRISAGADGELSAMMGACGRGMFREMIMGGVTEHMLEHADIPLLLSH